MEHEVIDLVVAVNHAGPVDRLRCWIFKELDHLVEMGDLANSNLRFHVHCLGLRRRDCTQCLDLAVVKPIRLPKAGEAMLICINTVKFSQRSDSIVPSEYIKIKLDPRVVSLHLRSVLGGDIRQRWIFEDPAIKKLHDVEGCS